jgi:hypothetical protein
MIDLFIRQRPIELSEVSLTELALPAYLKFQSNTQKNTNQVFALDSIVDFIIKYCVLQKSSLMPRQSGTQGTINKTGTINKSAAINSLVLCKCAIKVKLLIAGYFNQEKQ